MDARFDDLRAVVRKGCVVTEAHALELFREAVYDLVEQRSPENVKRCLAASRLLERAREEIEPTGSPNATPELARR